ncbi:MAG: DUF4843 domain-containing protein [Prevotella sp.]|nr:DUF4843 domain-containing protein [Prevotella sp.]
MKIKNIIILAVLASIIYACTEEDYKLYDTAQKDSVFFEYRNNSNVVDSTVLFVFNYDIATEHVIELPVTLMGMPADHDRKIELVPVKDATDMSEGTNYIIENAVLPANEVQTIVKVRLLRNLDERLLTDTLHLKLEIAENEDLRPAGLRTFSIAYSDVRPKTRPAWWTTYSALPIYSFENAQLFFKYFYELAPVANRDVFDEMIARYGDYFVKATNMQGPLAMYDTFLYKYVIMKMYDDTKDQLEWQAVPTIN